MSTPFRISIPYGKHELVLETGEIARQATGSVVVSLGETVILVTAVGNPNSDGSLRDFFPLTVDYIEKTYAAGRVPGGFFKREGKPSEKEVLTSRLIDRPLRPSFTKGFKQDVHVVATVLSVDPEIDPDIPALIGASAALSISGMPFNGPLAACRVGYIDNEYVLNPDTSELESSKLDLVVAGSEKAVLMVESEAESLSEQIMLGAVMYGHNAMQSAINAIKELQQHAAKPAWDWTPPAQDADLADKIKNVASAGITEAYQITDKLERRDKIQALRAEIIAGLTDESGDSEYSNSDIVNLFHDLEKKIVRSRITSGEKRIDGRSASEIRDITTKVGVLPRTHGSSLFTRGETQSIVVTTLGTGRDAQLIDALEGERKERFMLHYNFPPFSVGEAGRVGPPKRREIGHGRLAKRGIQAVMPDMDEFPYVIRVVSEITESNGSSSMATVCGTSLSLMDAGVPIKEPVAGIAMGLVLEQDGNVVLSDILGDEDHLGDMDFKVAGTEQGITALQMDIKIDGITEDIMAKALDQAHDGRLHILGEMAKTIQTPRTDMSEWAPRIISFKIHPDKIRDVIGKGGVTIRGITEDTGATVDIDDDGTVKIASVDKAGGEEARKIINAITADVEVGMIYEGKVIKIMDFGAFVNILPGKDGLVHISQISKERVNTVTDKLTEGDIVKVKVLEVDKQGRVRLSMKAVEETV